jgi:alcohol dehydrogenase class IV
VIVAVGGGSVLDAAKVARWLVGRGLADVARELRGNRGERWPKAGPLPLPLVALPTTAGTGAEVSPVAVVLNDELGVKVNLLSPFIAADVAVLDAELTLSLPPEVTAFTGFDALTHALEAFFSPKASAVSDAFALQAMHLCLQVLPEVVRDGSDVPLRQRMLEASLLGIVAFGQALDAIPVHNLAHAIGGRLGIAHGLCNAVLLPEVMAALPQHYLGRAPQLAARLGLGDAGEPAAALDALIGRIRDLRRQIGLPQDFSGRGTTPPPAGELRELVRRDPAGVAYELPAEVVDRVAAAVFPPR